MLRIFDKKKKVNFFDLDNLVDELILYIFFYCDVRDLLTLCQVSKRFKQIASENLLWKSYIARDFKYDFAKKIHENYRSVYWELQKARMFKLLKNEELRFAHLQQDFDNSFYDFFATPLLISYAVKLSINPQSILNIPVNVLGRESYLANYLLKKMKFASRCDYKVLTQIFKFVQRVCPSSQAPSQYTVYVSSKSKNYPLLHLYNTFKLLAEKYAHEIIFFKDYRFLANLNNVLMKKQLSADKLLIFSQSLYKYPQIITHLSATLFLDKILKFLKKQEVSEQEIINYYRKILNFENTKIKVKLFVEKHVPKRGSSKQPQSISENAKYSRKK